MKIKDGVLISINKSKDIKDGKFVIPNNVTSIGRSAFFNCKSLKNIVIPNSVTLISFYAFKNCTGLTSITIPDSVTTIEGGAFYGCTSLTSIVIPNSVTSIGLYALAYCSSLTNVTIGNSVRSIGYCAFTHCDSLTNINIPNSVTSIDSAAFYDCIKLIKEDEKYYYKAFNKDLTCRFFQYEENKWFEEKEDIELCKKGFHACKNAFDLFNYYQGKLNEDLVIYQVELEGVSEERKDDSKVVARKIRLVKKINSYKELLN